MRSYHESTLHPKNCMVTLTFNDLNLPEDRCVKKIDIQKFMRRLRKKHDKTIRYFGCGEYGDNNARPHYHICLFNHDFHDKELETNNDDLPVYSSKDLDKLWQNDYGELRGFTTVSPFSFDTAAYVARYVTKKWTGDKAEEAYKFLDKETGELYSLDQEFALMSRRPGIGKPWFDKYAGDVYPKDFTTIKGVKMRPPKYYDALHEKLHPEFMYKQKLKRKEVQNNNLEEQYYKRLHAKEAVKKAATKSLKRRLESC